MIYKYDALTVLGSTGSIGTQTLEIAVDRNIVALTANKNTERLARQVKEITARQGFAPKTANTIENIEELARTAPSEILVNAIVGSAGLTPTLAALENPALRRLALANKESLVCAGTTVMDIVRRKNIELLPIDSEHSAIHQCLRSGEHGEIARLILTASGGPFRGRKNLNGLTADDALRHPTWSMGAKITVDSATMMNKGFEVIEAHHLFGVPYERISVLVHPQSIVHSMVEFADGAVIAQLGTPDMRVPISYALNYPERAAIKNSTRLDLAKIGALTFEEPDTETFPLLPLSYRAGKIGDGATAAMCRANDEAVTAFLQGEIELREIFTYVLERTIGV